MDWDRLRIFHIVADAGSFSHASEEINTSQSAISRQVSNLEYEVGMPLFHRHARGLILTEQGELLYKRTRNIVDIIKDAEFELIDSKERPSGDLSVTTTVGLGTNWLTPRLKDFTSKYPEINLELRLTDTSDRLYFEPLTTEDVFEIIKLEQETGKLIGVIVQFGGANTAKII